MTVHVPITEYLQSIYVRFDILHPPYPTDFIFFNVYINWQKKFKGKSVIYRILENIARCRGQQKGAKLRDQRCKSLQPLDG